MPQGRGGPPPSKEELIKKLKGLAPPPASSLSEEAQLAMFRKLMEPRRKSESFDLREFDEQGNRMYADIELPPSPYPFKQPATMNKGIDQDVRDIRKYAPGAGTAQPSTLTTVPPTGYIAGNTREPLQSKIFKGEFDPADTTLLGMSPNTGSKEYGNNVYINPKLPEYSRGSVVAHELSHRNDPSTEDEGQFSFKPGAQYVEDLWNELRIRDKNIFNRGLSSDKRKMSELSSEEIDKLFRRR